MKKILNKVGKFLKRSKTTKVLTVEQTKEKITSLRMEMTHFAIESVAVSILALVLFIGAPSVFPNIINPYLPSALKIMQVIVAVPAVFWIITILGNMVRYFKILKLQNKLSK